MPRSMLFVLATLLALAIPDHFRTSPLPGDSERPALAAECLNGNGILGFMARERGAVDFIAVAAESPYPTGTLTVPALPPGATIRRAWFYFWNQRTSPPPKSFSFDGLLLKFDAIGYVPGRQGSKSERDVDTYRSDVTSFLSGAGAHTWTLAAGGKGGALLIIYEDPALVSEYDIEVHDGAHGGLSFDGIEKPWPNPTAFTGFVVDGSVAPEVEVATLTVAGSPDVGERFLFAASDPESLEEIGANVAMSGFEWDRFDVSSFYLGGETTGFLNAFEVTDNILLEAAVLRVRIQPPIVDTTPPVFCCAVPGSGAVVGASPLDFRLEVRDQSAVSITSVPPLAWSPAAFAAPTAGETSASLALSEGPNVFVVTATDAFGNASSSEITVTLDTGLPSVAIVTPLQDEFVSSTSILLSANVVDATSTSVTSSPPAISVALPAGGGAVSGIVELVEGPNELVVTAIDGAGNAAGSLVHVVRDTIAPTIDVISPADGAIVAESPAHATIQVVDENATTLLVGGQSWSLPPGGGIVVVDVALTPGLNALTATAVDPATNSVATSLHITLDLDAPILTFLSPTAGTVFPSGTTCIPVVVGVDDFTHTTVTSTPGGIDAAVAAGGGIVTGCLPFVEGSNLIQVSAVDATGRGSTTSISVIVDSTPPEANIAAPTASAALKGVVDFHVVAADVPPGSGIARVAFYVDADPLIELIVAPYESTLETRALSDGPHILRARVEDGAANVTWTTAAVVVDNTPPTVAIDQPAVGAFASGSLTFDASALDSGSGLIALEMRVAGVAPTSDGSIAFQPAVPNGFAHGLEDTTRWPDGPLGFFVTARDAAGNEAVASLVLTVDNTAPARALVQPTDGSVVAGIVTIVAVAGDPNLVALEILVDGQSLGHSTTSPFALSYDTRQRLDGAMAIGVRAVDGAGNVGIDAATVTVDNISVRIDPSSLNLKSKGGSQSITVHLEGPNLGCLLPTEAHALALRVAGGNPVPSVAGWPGDDATLDSDADGVPELVLKFDRTQLIAAIRAGVAGGFVGAMGSVAITLQADDGAVLGTDALKIVGN